jgi:hypothetical protein
MARPGGTRSAPERETSEKPDHSHLLSPLKIGNTVLKNRMIASHSLPDAGYHHVDRPRAGRIGGSSFLGVRLRALDLEEKDGLVAHHPTVVARRDIDDVTGLRFELGAIVHARAEVAR